MRQKTTEHYSPRATLAALGTQLQHLKLFAPIEQNVQIKQKTVKHAPAEKLKDAFIAILAGAHGLAEINTRVRSDEALQRAFGRTGCAEQSVVQRTLDACTQENVRQMQHAIDTIFRTHSSAFRHDYRVNFLLLDIDMTGRPCGPKAALSKKGYFSKDGIRYGRQVGRVAATDYGEVVVDRLFAGNVQLTTALRPLVEALEQTLELNNERRSRTILRVDAGGGSLGDVNWCLERGYQLHGKDISGSRAKAWSSTVHEWHTDPQHPDRQMGWVVPLDTPDYVRPVRRLAIRWRKRNGHFKHAMLVSTLTPRDVLQLLNQPAENINQPASVALAYAQFYDQRGGAVEIEIKESKQGIGLTKRRKKQGDAQQMVVLLSSLAHNVLVWAKRRLSAKAPQLARLGLLRLVRDLLHISGQVELDQRSKMVVRIALNRAAPLAGVFVNAWRDTLLGKHVAISLRES